MKLHPWLAAFLILLGTGNAFGQVATGTPPFGSFGGGPFDTVNLGNLNVHFAIPVLHKAGRGLSLAYDLSYDSSVWTPTSVNGVMTWVPDSNWGWRGWSEAAVGYISYTYHRGYSCGIGNGYTHYWDTYVYHDPFGVSHAFSGNDFEDCDSNFSGLNDLSTDGSGYTLNIPSGLDAGPFPVTIISAGGQVRTPPQQRAGAAGTRTDPNGNQITISSNGTQFFDTLSSTTPVLTVSSPAPPAATTFTYTAPSGSAAYNMNYQLYTVKTTFGLASVPGEYGPLSNSLVSSIRLPDGSSYVFTYEQTQVLARQSEGHSRSA